MIPPMSGPDLAAAWAWNDDLCPRCSLMRISQQVNAGFTLEEVLEKIFGSFHAVIPYDRIGLALLEEHPVHGRLLRSRWAKSEGPELHLKTGFAAPVAGSTLAPILDTGRPRILNDLEAYLESKPSSEATRLIVDEGMRSSLTCPLAAEGKRIGVLFFSSLRKETYRDAHVEIFMEIAGQVSIAVERSRMVQRLVDLDEAKNRFLGMAAHDLRNPLVVVQGYLSLLLKGKWGALSDPQATAVRRAAGASETMLRLVHDLLDVQAIEAGRIDLQPRGVPLHALLAEAVEGNRMIAEAKSIGVRLGEVPEVRAVLDPHRIRQALDNLVSNALKFSHPGTAVVVSAAVKGGWVEIRVVDQGQGIPEAEISRLFRDFGRASVKPTGGEKSIGLGLAIVRRIAEAHGGSVSVESRPGEGSVFTVRLPLEGPSPAAPSTA